MYVTYYTNEMPFLFYAFHSILMKSYFLRNAGHTVDRINSIKNHSPDISTPPPLQTTLLLCVNVEQNGPFLRNLEIEMDSYMEWMEIKWSLD